MDNQSASFCLKKKENGYTLYFENTNWLPLLGYGFSFQYLSGFIEFKKKDELIFKEVPINQLSLKSVISIIKSELQDWVVIRFDFITDNNRAIEFYTGGCSIDLVDEEIFPYLKWLLNTEIDVFKLYNLLLENLDGSILLDSAEMTIITKCDFSLGEYIEETESPF